jgi:hypothetical protein
VTLPELSDSTDLRVGPEINPALLGVLPLVGEWAGHGTVKIPATREDKQYAQRVTFSHDGRPFLSYASHTWLLNPDGTVLRPAFRENGFWRVGPGEDDLELVLATAAGIVEVFKGTADHLRWELQTTAVGMTPTAKTVSGERRLYALVDESLVYAEELAIEPGDFRPHLNAQLSRVPGQ